MLPPNTQKHPAASTPTRTACIEDSRQQASMPRCTFQRDRYPGRVIHSSWQPHPGQQADVSIATSPSTAGRQPPSWQSRGPAHDDRAYHRPASKPGLPLRSPARCSQLFLGSTRGVESLIESFPDQCCPRRIGNNDRHSQTNMHQLASQIVNRPGEGLPHLPLPSYQLQPGLLLSTC